jgi:hypothetical protein
MPSDIIDLGGNTVVVKNIRTGATAPGQTGTDLSTTELAVLDGATSANSGTNKAVITGTSGALTVPGVLTNPGGYTSTGGVTAKSGTAVPASAGAIAAGAPITMFSTGIKIWVTSDVPAFSATKGDLCLNTGGSSTSTRLFINNGTTNWVAITTAS